MPKEKEENHCRYRGTLDLLCNHPEGGNKIQDRCRSENFVLFGKHPVPNAYHIKSKGQVWTVIQYQLQELSKTQEDKGALSSTSNNESHVPSFNPKQMKKNANTSLCHLKGRPLTLSLSKTASVGSGGLRKAHTQQF